MKLHTSINIQVSLLAKLDNEAEKRGLSNQDLAVLILHSYAKKALKNLKIGETVKYQEKGEKYKRIYLRLALNEYEFFLDIRKLAKCSVSKLLAIALDDFFLENVARKLIPDKVELYGVQLLEDGSGIYEWHLIWGIGNNNNGFYYEKRE